MKKIVCTIVLGFLLAPLFSKVIFAQDANELKILNQYQRFGFVAGPALYNRAELKPQFGSGTFKNFPIWGFNAGFEYDFYPEKRWSFITGLFVAKEPIYKAQVYFVDGDIFENYGESIEDFKAYAIVSFSVPVYISLKKKLWNRVYGQLRTGLKVMYLPPGDAYTSMTYTNQDIGITKEVWGIKAQSQDYSYYGSFIVGCGISWAAKRFLIKTNMIYVMNFQPTMFGEYQFDNLLITEHSRGYYTLTGNYIALLFTFHFNKPKDKWN